MDLKWTFSGYSRVIYRWKRILNLISEIVMLNDVYEPGLSVTGHVDEGYQKREPKSYLSF